VPVKKYFSARPIKVLEFSEQFDSVLEFSNHITEGDHVPHTLSIGYMQGLHWAESASKYSEWSFSTEIGVIESCKFPGRTFHMARDLQELTDHGSENRTQLQLVPWERVLEGLSCYIHQKPCHSDCRLHRKEVSDQEGEATHSDSVPKDISFNLYCWDLLQAGLANTMKSFHFYQMNKRNLCALPLETHCILMHCKEQEVLIITKDKEDINKASPMKFVNAKKKWKCVMQLEPCGSSCSYQGVREAASENCWLPSDCVANGLADHPN